MATIDIVFNDKTYSIEESAFEAAAAALRTHFLSAMSGSGASINLGGTTYNIDSTKLSTATTNFVTHLGKISGSGSKVTVGGVEYSFAPSKVQDAIADLEVVLGDLVSGGNEGGSELVKGEAVLEEKLYKFGRGEGGIYTALPGLDNSIENFELIVGDSYCVVLNGNEYTCVAKDFSGMPLIGNLSLAGMGDDTGEPFFAAVEPDGTSIFATFETGSNTTEETTWHTVGIYKLTGGNGGDGEVVLEEGTYNFIHAEVNGAGIRVTTPSIDNNVSNFVLDNGETYKVVWDGVEYTCVAQECGGGVFVGNLSVANMGANTGEPFLAGVDPTTGAIIGTADTVMSHTIAIYRVSGGNEGDGESRVTILEETTIEVTGSSWQGKGEELYANILALNEGDAIEVVWDGTKYNCIGVVHVNNGINTVMFGNLGLFGEGENTGEPFLLSVVADYSIVNINTLDTVDTSHTVAIYKVSGGNSDSSEELVFAEQTVEFEDLFDGLYMNSIAFTPVLGETYRVVWDGQEYVLTAHEEALDGGDISSTHVYLGNITIFTDGDDTGEPFLIMTGNETSVMTYDTASSHTIAIYKLSGGNGGSVEGEVILAEQTAQFEYCDDSCGAEIDSQNAIVGGETYKVMWDDTEYMCEAIEGDDGVVMIGNMLLFGGDDNEMPFACMYIPPEELFFFISVYETTDSSHSVAIYKVSGSGNGGSSSDLIFENANLSGFEALGSVCYSLNLDTTIELVVGETYKVVWDGQEFNVQAKTLADSPCIGNLNIVNQGDNTGEPFLIGAGANIMSIYTKSTASNHSVAIYKVAGGNGGSDNLGEVVLAETVLNDFEEQTNVSDQLCYNTTLNLDLAEGQIYRVVWDGKEYFVDAAADDDGVIFIGNFAILFDYNFTNYNTHAPFLIATNNEGITELLTPEAGSHTIAIYKVDGAVLMPTQIQTSGYNSAYGLYSIDCWTDGKHLTIGNTYRVIWDGVSYDCIAEDASSMLDGAVFIGNGSIFGLNGNNEPFVIGWTLDGAMFIDINDTEETNHSFAVYDLSPSSALF